MNGSVRPIAALGKELFSFKGPKSYRVVSLFLHSATLSNNIQFGMCTRPTLSVLVDD